MISRAVISTFLSHFCYLDDKGKRRGFLFFNNKALTEAHEQNAKELQAALTAFVKEGGMTEEAKCASIVVALQEAFDTCIKAREDCVPWSHYSKFEGSVADLDAGTREYDYKNPYKPSKFEKELIAGIDAVIQLLAQFISPRTDVYYLDIQHHEMMQQKVLAEKLKKECCTLLYDIHHFTPKQVVKNWRFD